MFNMDSCVNRCTKKCARQAYVHVHEPERQNLYTRVLNGMNHSRSQRRSSNCHVRGTDQNGQGRAVNISVEQSYSTSSTSELVRQIHGDRGFADAALKIFRQA